MQLTLEIQIAGAPATVVQRQGTRLCIGRNPECDFALPDIQTSGIASSRHAEFYVRDGVLFVKDLGSSNGTFQNGQILTDELAIALGGSVELGCGGPVVRVVEFDPADQPRRISGRGWIAVAGGSVIVLAAAVMLLNGLPGSGPESDSAASMETVSSNSGASNSTTAAEVDQITTSTPSTAVGDIGVQLTSRTIEPLDEVLRAIGCLGFQFDGDLHGDETAWLISPDRAVTTARAARRLQLLAEKASGQRLELVVASLASYPIRIKGIRLHPGYDFNNPGSPESLLHDVAELTLAETASGTSFCRLADDDAVSAITIDSELRVVGFENQTKVTELFDPLRIRRCEVPLTITGGEQPAGRAQTFYKSSLPLTRGMTGSPVFDSAGNVVGLVTQRNEVAVVVPAAVIREFLSL